MHVVIWGDGVCLPLVAILMKLTSYQTLLRQTQKAQVLSLSVVYCTARDEVFCMSRVCMAMERKEGSSWSVWPEP